MINTTTQCVLKSRSGKYVTVTDEPFQLPKLCLRDSQTELYVDIHERVKDTQNQVALSFRRRSGVYTLKVEKENLKLEKSGPITEDHWFDKTNQGSGSGYGLQSVKSPCKYLSVKDTGNVFSLEDHVYLLNDSTTR